MLIPSKMQLRKPSAVSITTIKTLTPVMMICEPSSVTGKSNAAKVGKMTILKDISIEKTNGTVSLRGVVVYDNINVPPIGFLIKMKESIAATLEIVRAAA